MPHFDFCEMVILFGLRTWSNLMIFFFIKLFGMTVFFLKEMQTSVYVTMYVLLGMCVCNYVCMSTCFLEWAFKVMVGGFNRLRAYNCVFYAWF